MSRSDGWSVAFTLVAAGIAYFIGGKYTAWGSIAVGAATILYLLATRKKTEPTPIAVKAIQKQEANPTQNQNVTLNLPAYPAPQPAAPAPRREPRPKPRPNLQINSYRMAKIDDALGDHGEVKGFYFPDDQSKPNAAVACIKNRANSDGEGVYLDNVRATLSFRDAQDNEIGHGINQACWVGGLFNATFDVEESHCVILAVMRGDEVGVPSLKEENTGMGMTISAQAYVFDKAPRSVELILVAQGRRVLEPTVFAFEDEHGEAIIKMKT
jgi:hypothetical protein